MIWNKARECMSRDELAILQGRRLVELVDYMYHNAGYYMKKMRRLGLEPGDIRGIEDLDKLPFTTKEDLIEAYPLGVFALPDSKIVRYHVSQHRAGYVGMETMAGYSQGDIDIQSECMARSISMAGLGERDVIQVAHSDGVCTDDPGASRGAEQVGAAVIPAAGCKPAVLTALMRRLQVTGVIGTSSELMQVAQIVGERGLKESLQLKAAMCEGSSWAESIRERLEERLGIRVYDIFSLEELTGLGVACECEYRKGMHIQEDFFLAEILDTNTMLVLPAGAHGELVFTSLQREGIPLIRYRTMHIARINYEKCQCGRTMARRDRLCCGMDDTLLIRGNSVSVSHVEAALCALRDIEASYIIRIREEHHIDVVDVYVESTAMTGALLSEHWADVKHRVACAIHRTIGVEPDVYDAGKNPFDTMLFKRKVTIVDERK